MFSSIDGCQANWSKWFNTETQMGRHRLPELLRMELAQQESNWLAVWEIKYNDIFNR